MMIFYETILTTCKLLTHRKSAILKEPILIIKKRIIILINSFPKGINKIIQLIKSKKSKHHYHRYYSIPHLRLSPQIQTITSYFYDICLGKSALILSYLNYVIKILFAIDSVNMHVYMF